MKLLYFVVKIPLNHSSVVKPPIYRNVAILSRQARDKMADQSRAYESHIQRLAIELRKVLAERDEALRLRLHVLSRFTFVELLIHLI